MAAPIRVPVNDESGFCDWMRVISVTAVQCAAGEEEHVTEAYLAHARNVTRGTADRRLNWAVDAVEDLVRRDPDAAWAVVVELISRADDDAILAYIAAGPLENLVVLHGTQVIGRIEAHAAADSRFRRALTGIWVEGDVPEEISKRLELIVRDASPL